MSRLGRSRWRRFADAKGRGVLKAWAATRAHHSLMAALGILYATLVALKPEHPPPAPARGLPDPPELEKTVTPHFKFALGILAVAAFAVLLLRVALSGL